MHTVKKHKALHIVNATKKWVTTGNYPALCLYSDFTLYPLWRKVLNVKGVEYA